jgi:hypothetical protein
MMTSYLSTRAPPSSWRPSLVRPDPKRLVRSYVASREASSTREGDDYYSLLNVKPNATPDQIRSAYRQMMRRAAAHSWHSSAGARPARRCAACGLQRSVGRAPQNNICKMTSQAQLPARLQGVPP